jgi:hypothetical protein
MKGGENMNRIEELAMELNEECRKNGVNFIIVIEDDGVNEMHSIRGNSELKPLVKVLKDM